MMHPIVKFPILGNSLRAYFLVKTRLLKKLDLTELSAEAETLSENVQAVKDLFPEVWSEGKIDFDVLRQLLGGSVDDKPEKYGLNWFGKRQSRQLALTRALGTLRPAPDESVNWETTHNLMIEGDNLEVLKLLQKSFAGKVKLIYIDPPYNTGKDFVYPDDFKDNVRNYLELTGQVEGGRKISSNTDASGRFHTDWLNMMYPRIKTAKSLLRNDGALCVSLDDTELPNFRLLANEIFGEENLIAVVSWQKVHTRKNSARTFSVSHDYVVMYARSIDAWDRVLLPREDSSAYKNPDNDPKGPWKPDPVTAHNFYSADYKIAKPNGAVLARPSGRYWAFSEATWKSKVDSGEVLWGEADSYPMIKRYLSEVQDGLVPVTLFSREFAGDTSTAKKEVDELFCTQGVFDYPKPTLLVRRLIQICTRQDDIVLDFFAGSGTTGHAVMAQNADDNGLRRYMLVQLPEPLDPRIEEQKTAADYCDSLNKPRTIAELTKERLRRAAAKVKASKPESSNDVGFRVFKLDSSNIRRWDPQSTDVEQLIVDSTDHIVAGRSEQDLFYELLLKLGYDLCAPVVTRTIANQTVHSIANGSLVCCLTESISRDDVEALANGIAEWHVEMSPHAESTCVFRDSAFHDDVAKANLTAILSQRGLKNVRSL